MEDLDIYTLLFLINIMSILVHMIKTSHINDINLLKNVTILAKYKGRESLYIPIVIFVCFRNWSPSLVPSLPFTSVFLAASPLG
jgi:hypothetical protein